MGFGVEGVDRLVGKLEAMPARVKFSVVSELDDIGKDLKADSQAVAPFEEGDLRAQAYSGVFESGDDPYLEMGYDGPRDYLLVQHEGGWRNFMGQYGPKRIENYTTPGTGPKFLERPWLENKPRYKVAVKDAVRKGLRG
jgi:hypothetical protein